ncbi:MAG: family 78 glycoside hydrolase catalytic domain [Nibricoccus sp.]
MFELRVGIVGHAQWLKYRSPHDEAYLATRFSSNGQQGTPLTPAPAAMLITPASQSPRVSFLRMNPLKTLLPILWFFLALAAPLSAATVAKHLRCEYRVDPMGIGETRPRLNWIIAADESARGVKQTAFQILVASTPELLAKDNADLWDSGKVASDRMQVEYAGKPLAARQACVWKVRLWDESGRPTAWSQPARFSIGLLTVTDWQAQWIGLDAEPQSLDAALDNATREKLGRQPWVYADLPESKTGPLSACLRGTFTVDPARKPTQALLAVVPDQRCTVTLNGRVVAALTRWQQLTPFDVTDQLVTGNNAIGLEIVQHDGHPPAALGAVFLRFADGTTQTVAIDTTWKFSVTPAPGWTTADFDATNWKPVVAPPAKRNPWDGPPQTFTYWLPPAAQLRKDFALTKIVRRATLYATALGAYELHLNGQRVGRDLLTPGWTDFNKRVQYQTYDVTAQLRSGQNALGAVLGDGWYASVLGYTGKRYFYGGYPRLLAQLDIEYTDGSRETLATDSTWRGTTAGPIRSADLMQGCTFDARLKNDDWANPKTDTAAWQPVAIGLRSLEPEKPLAKFQIEAANADAARAIEELPACSITEPRPGAYTFDLGQNITGWVRLKVSGRPGQKIMVRHGEALNPDGSLYTSNLRGANATDVYFPRGDGIETLEPFSTFHGFRYVEVTGLETKPALDAVTGIVVHSAMERTGTFECSSPLVNRLFQNIIWGQKGNYLEVPTDCPQRDERAGWSGDAQFFVRTGTYNFDVAAFMARWLTTLAVDSQLPEGSIANVAPAFGGLWASPGWGGDGVIVCVHELYRTYGDTRVIAHNYDAMARYLTWLAGEKKPGGIRLRELGDHLNLGGGANLNALRVAHRAHLNQLMAEMAAALGRNDDAASYSAAHAEAKAEFQRDYVLPDGSIRESGQTGYALAFSMNLLADGTKPRVTEKFVDEIKKHNWHLATGFIGTPRLLPALHLAGRDDVAYKLLLQETFPSWLFQVKNGATTVWERWDGWTPEKGFQTIAMNSFNHYAFGSVGEFLYRQIAGIDAGSPGFRTIVIRPTISEGLTSARATYNSVSGPIFSAWKLDGNKLTLDVEIPPNTTATIRVPASSAEVVKENGQPAAKAKGITFERFENSAAVFSTGSGKYHFTSTISP